ncbi:hypothetical protein BN14_09763 [Rhizoctonia solani AG-1 IB]|uniref:Uncharacterized protein n=1 Tax=Thanatephorus cucumeris (strain AG1-IB / isolate 7/3/14) TaxID=1108050 RepID=M5C9E3_THACB|nr:hypothetical protein BN14_09763 [Rhizoctonia solani AG-1 IB]
MPLPSLSESLGRSKARLKRWLNIDIKPTTQNIAPVVRDMCPSVRSLIAQIQSSAEVFGPLKSAISELARVFESYDVCVFAPPIQSPTDLSAGGFPGAERV